MVATRSRRRCEVALFAATEGDSLRDFPGKQVDGKRQIPGECSKNYVFVRSEEHTSELQSRLHLVCRLLLGKKKQIAERTLFSHHFCISKPHITSRSRLLDTHFSSIHHPHSRRHQTSPTHTTHALLDCWIQP